MLLLLLPSTAPTPILATYRLPFHSLPIPILLLGLGGFHVDVTPSHAKQVAVPAPCQTIGTHVSKKFEEGKLFLVLVPLCRVSQINQSLNHLRM